MSWNLSKCYGLKLTLEKTIPPVIAGGVLTIVDEATYLGVTIDHTGITEKGTLSRCEREHGILQQLRRK